MTVADNSENEQLRKVNEEQSKKISTYQREIIILEEKLKEKDAELEKRKTELSHLRQGSKIGSEAILFPTLPVRRYRNFRPIENWAINPYP